MGFNCPHCAQDIGNAVPLDRFEEVNRKRKDAEKAAADAATAIEEARKGAADVDTIRAELDRAREELVAATTGHDAYKEITGAGISSEVVNGFLDSYNGLGEDRPATIGEWVNGMCEGTIQPPALLRPHLPGSKPETPAAPASTAAPETPATRPPASPPSANTAAQPHPHAPDPYSAEAITRMTPTEYKAFKAQRNAGS